MEQQIMLVRQAKAGDVASFAELYRGIYQSLYRMALYTLKNSHDAEDAVSDTVVDAWAQIGTLRQEEAFSSWIFRILSNKCRRKLKEYINRTEELPEDFCADSGDTEENLDVRNAYAKLDDEERMILSLRIFGGYSSREIGEALQMNDNTVRSRQKRALEKMERYLTL